MDRYLSVDIFVDGSCIGNGTANVRAGYGIFCFYDEDLNWAARLDGRQTVQRAQLVGAIQAAERAVEFGYEKVRFKMDREYVVKGIQEWYPGWVEEGRRNVPNFRLFETLECVLEDIEDWKFLMIPKAANRKADQLSRIGAREKFGYGKNHPFDDLFDDDRLFSLDYD